MVLILYILSKVGVLFFYLKYSTCVKTQHLTSIYLKYITLSRNAIKYKILYLELQPSDP